MDPHLLHMPTPIIVTFVALFVPWIALGVKEWRETR